jgi:hypothetical protein
VCEAHATHENGVLNIDVLLQHDRRIPSLCEELNNISLGHSSEEVNEHLTPFLIFFCVLSSSRAKHIVFTELCRLLAVLLMEPEKIPYWGRHAGEGAKINFHVFAFLFRRFFSISSPLPS